MQCECVYCVFTLSDNYPPVVYKTDLNWVTAFPSGPVRFHTLCLWYSTPNNYAGVQHLAVLLTLCSWDTMLKFTTGTDSVLMLAMSAWEVGEKAVIGIYENSWFRFII